MSFTDGGTYYANRVAKDNEQYFSGSSSITDVFSKGPGAAVNTQMNNGDYNEVGPLWLRRDSIPSFGVDNGTAGQGLAVGNSWLNSTSCAKAIISDAGGRQNNVCNFPHDSGTPCDQPSSDGKTCDTGWCSLKGVLQNDDPSACSNAAGFSQADTFSSLEFDNSVSGLGFGSATLMVTPNYAGLSKTSTQTYNPLVKTGGSFETYMDHSFWSGIPPASSSGAAPIEANMGSWENGKITCFMGKPAGSGSSAPYGYGSDATKNAPAAQNTSQVLDAKENVSFGLCYLHQQLQKCINGTNVCNGDTCCAALGSTTDACFNGLGGQGGGYCSRFGVVSHSSPYFVPFAQWFNILLGGDNSTTICQDADGTQSNSCVLFNGVVKPSSSGSQFKYEPNPWKDPRNFASKGPVLGVPIQFSLMYSANGSSSDPSTSSYLSQFVNDRSSASPGSGSAEADYRSQAGFVALGDWWSALSTALSGSDAYTAFAKMYYAYAVTNRFLLSIYQLAPFASEDATTFSPFGLFQDATVWKTSVAGVWTDLTTTNGIGSLLTDLTASDLFASSQPQVGAIDSNNEISVTLTVPPLLFSWSPADLLFRAFPKTGAGFATTTAFTQTFAYDQILAKGPAVAQDTFQVVAGSATTTYYQITTSNQTPAAAGQAAVGSASAVTVAAKTTFKIKVAEQSLTLLFYLYYLKQNKMELIKSASNFVLSSAPAIEPVPSFLNWSNACDIIGTGQCTNQSGYAGLGASAVNLFLNNDSTVCRCLYPANVQSGLESDALWDNAALCFNSYCLSTSQTAIDLDSILASDTAGKCPTGATAVANVKKGVITAVTVMTNGAYYTAAPDVVFTGSVGQGASATATIEDGSVTKIVVDEGGTGYTDSVVVEFVPAEPAGKSFDCAAECDTYIRVVENESVDLSAVNLTALNNLCDYDVTKKTTGFLPAPTFLAVFVLVLACVPLCTVATLAAVGARQKTLSGTVVSKPAFIAPVITCFLLCCAVAAYMWVDMQGHQNCVDQQTIYSKGVNWPASNCMSNGFFGLLPEYELPAGFCAAERSFCQCDFSDPDHAVKCSAGGCGCKDKACCSANGLCTGETLSVAPLTGRKLTLLPTEEKFSPLVAVLSGAAALCLVPAGVLAFWYGAPADVEAKPLLAVVVAVFLLVLAAIPLAVQGLAKPFYQSFVVGVGNCTQLTDYPQTLTWTADTATVWTQDANLDSNGLPTYSRPAESTTSDTCASCTGACASADGCGCACLLTSLAYDKSAGTWAFTSTGATFWNDESSATLYKGDGTSSNPRLYAGFYNASDKTQTFQVCGNLNAASSCSSCACSA